MEKPKRPRLNPLLLLALLATVAAAIFAPDAQQSADTVAPVPRTMHHPASNAVDESARHTTASQVRPSEPAVAADEHRIVAPPVRMNMESRIVDIFSMPKKSASRTAKSSAPAVPVMPALDYQYMGRVIDQGEQSLLFTRRGRPYVIKPGDTLDGNFLLESVSGNAAVFVYVPLSMKTTIVLEEGK